jgi:hypothetical protein
MSVNFRDLSRISLTDLIFDRVNEVPRSLKANKTRAGYKDQPVVWEIKV